MSNIDKLKPGKYAVLFRNNWDGEGDTYEAFATLDAEGIWRNEDGDELLEYQGDEVLRAWSLDDGSNVLALLDELEAKDAKIANITAERDALREGEMGDAKHSNTMAAADIYFQLVEECEIPAGGSLVEYVSDLRIRAAAGKGE